MTSGFEGTISGMEKVVPGAGVASELANAFGAYARGGEVGNAAGIEFHANVSDVDLVSENGEADGANFFYGRVNERENDVEIVNHEIEDDVDVERARGEWAEAVDLKKHRLSNERQG
jgi:hypothetical protein